MTAVWRMDSQHSKWEPHGEEQWSRREGRWSPPLRGRAQTWQWSTAAGRRPDLTQASWTTATRTAPRATMRIQMTQTPWRRSHRRYHPQTLRYSVNKFKMQELYTLFLYVVAFFLSFGYLQHSSGLYNKHAQSSPIIQVRSRSLCLVNPDQWSPVQPWMFDWSLHSYTARYPLIAGIDFSDFGFNYLIRSYHAEMILTQTH